MAEKSPACRASTGETIPGQHAPGKENPASMRQQKRKNPGLAGDWLALQALPNLFSYQDQSRPCYQCFQFIHSLPNRFHRKVLKKTNLRPLHGSKNTCALGVLPALHFRPETCHRVCKRQHVQSCLNPLHHDDLCHFLTVCGISDKGNRFVPACPAP